MATFKLIKTYSFVEFTNKMKAMPRLALNLTQKSTGTNFDALAYVKTDETIFVSFAKDVDKDGQPKQGWTHIERKVDFLIANADKLIICESQKFNDDGTPVTKEVTLPDGTKTTVFVYAYTLSWQSANSWQIINLPGCSF